MTDTVKQVNSQQNRYRKEETAHKQITQNSRN